MSRHVDETGTWFDVPGWNFNRPAATIIEEHDGSAAVKYSVLELLRDVELGIRVSQWLDGMEDVDDIDWRFGEAEFEAWAKLGIEELPEAKLPRIGEAS